MEPENVTPRNFKPKHILYNKNDFSIVYGAWEGEKDVIAMRWNGEGESVGYPSQGKYPTWFIISDDLAITLPKLPENNHKTILDGKQNKGIQLYAAYGEAADTTVPPESDFNLLKTYTTSTFDVVFPLDTIGKRVFLMDRLENTLGETGPWGEEINFVIPS